MNQADRLGNTPLHVVAENGQHHVVAVLIEYGEANVNSANKDKDTPLHIAARCDFWTTEELIRQGAKTNLKNSIEQSPLQIAVEAEHKNGVAADRNGIVDVLVRNGSNINVRGPNNSTLLHSAAREGYCDILEALIANGAEVNAQDSLGETPLHKAARWDREECIQFLIYRGAGRNVKNYDGKLPFELATDRYCIVVLRRFGPKL